jgi:hypothetical protein
VTLETRPKARKENSKKLVLSAISITDSPEKLSPVR